MLGTAALGRESRGLSLYTSPSDNNYIADLRRLNPKKTPPSAKRHGPTAMRQQLTQVRRASCPHADLTKGVEAGRTPSTRRRGLLRPHGGQVQQQREHLRRLSQTCASLALQSHRAVRIRYNRASACGGLIQRALRRHPVRERRLTAGVIALPATIDALPEALATYFHVRPYAINAINLKLRDLLLDLIAIGATTTTPS